MLECIAHLPDGWEVGCGGVGKLAKARKVTLYVDGGQHPKLKE